MAEKNSHGFHRLHENTTPILMPAAAKKSLKRRPADRTMQRTPPELSVGECVAKNSERRNPDAPISVHEFDPIKNRFRVIRWNDVAHESVTFCADTKNRQHNNPPANLAKVDDTGNSAGTFARA